MAYSVKFIKDLEIREFFSSTPQSLHSIFHLYLDRDWAVLETWEWIKGYEGKYKISNLGRVKSFKGKKPRIMKQRPTKHGYLRVCLYGDSTPGAKKNHNRQSFLVHCLVAEAFCYNPEPEILDEVDHINRIVDDNVFYNLRWANREMQFENMGNKEELPF